MNGMQTMHVSDIVCKQEDYFGWFYKKVVEADALVIGAYSPYISIDAFTKVFLERLWSLSRKQSTQRKTVP